MAATLVIWLEASSHHHHSRVGTEWSAMLPSLVLEDLAAWVHHPNLKLTLLLMPLRIKHDGQHHLVSNTSDARILKTYTLFQSAMSVYPIHIVRHIRGRRDIALAAASVIVAEFHRDMHKVTVMMMSTVYILYRHHSRPSPGSTRENG